MAFFSSPATKQLRTFTRTTTQGPFLTLPNTSNLTGLLMALTSRLQLTQKIIKKYKSTSETLIHQSPNTNFSSYLEPNTRLSSMPKLSQMEPPKSLRAMDLLNSQMLSSPTELFQKWTVFSSKEKYSKCPLPTQNLKKKTRKIMKSFKVSCFSGKNYTLSSIRISMTLRWRSNTKNKS